MKKWLNCMNRHSFDSVTDWLDNFVFCIRPIFYLLLVVIIVEVLYFTYS